MDPADTKAYKGRFDKRKETSNPDRLEEGTHYYWRGDENSDAGAATGDVWSFRMRVGKAARLSVRTPAPSGRFPSGRSLTQRIRPRLF